MNKWVLEQMKCETFLETEITKLKLSYFRHVVRRQGSSEKTIVLGKQKAAGEEEDKCAMD